MRPNAMTGTGLPALLLTLAILAGGTPLWAQSGSATRSDPTGLVLGAHLNGSAISWEDVDDIESGGGLGFLVGYAFNRTAMLYLAADGASMSAAGEDDSYTLGHGDLGIRLHFGGPESAALFYLDGAFSSRLARQEYLGSDFDASGFGGSVGGGLEYFFSPKLALDVGLKFTFGSFSEARYEGDTAEIDLSANSTRFNVGVSWYSGR